MKSVLITGAHGFIGRYLARHCQQRWNATVVGLGHGTFSGSELTGWGMHSSLNGDVSFANLRRVVDETEPPDVIFHLAGGNSVSPSLRVPQEDFLRTVNTTCDLLEWVRTDTPSSLVVLASSAAVYGAGYSQPISEECPALPYSPYGFHKRMAEMLCQSYSHNFGLDTRIIRFFSVYGPELRKQLLWDTCQRLAAGQRDLEMQGTGQEQRDWLHIHDCVTYLCTVAEASLPKFWIGNCGTGIATSVQQVVQLITERWSDGASCRFSGQVRAGDPQHLVADSRSAIQLGWKPTVPWHIGVANYIDWFKSYI